MSIKQYFTQEASMFDKLFRDANSHAGYISKKRKILRMKKQILNFKMVIGMFIAFLLLNQMETQAQKSPQHDFRTLPEEIFESSFTKIEGQKQSKSYKAGSAIVTELIDQYLFPSDLDNEGETVVIQPFGNSEETFLWTKDGGITTISGEGTSIATNGTIAGSFNNENFPGGSAIAAGTWDMSTQEWTFLGINPDYPNAMSGEYNDAWGQSIDGSVIVGLQWTGPWAAAAFKWTPTDGYINITDNLDGDSRASGVSRNGEVIYGWTLNDFGGWSPVIWKNDLPILLNPGGEGEAMCASKNGTYVSGRNDGYPFIWSEDGGMVNYGTDMDFPTIVLEDGSAFGFTGIFPPTMRVAFYKDSLGEMTTFNNYAESRGMENSQDWNFYSVNNVNMDGNKFIGAGVNPSGQDVCFLIEFTDVPSLYNLSLSANPVEGGVVTGGGEFEAATEVTIEASANENYKFINWTNLDGDVISTDSITVYTMPEANTELFANFQSTVDILETEFADMKIYPIPANDFINIDMIPENSEITLTNLLGEVLISNSNYSNTKARINTSNLQSGVYFIIVKTGNKHIANKIHIIK